MQLGKGRDYIIVKNSRKIFTAYKWRVLPFDNVDGVGAGCIVENTGHPLSVCVGDELLGHTVDGIGRITDADCDDIKLPEAYPIEAPPPDPMSREIISEVLPLGVKAVDGLITVGKGQRIGIFAGSGVGKSTLLGMFARNTRADINVIALIGERGREVREFIERDLGPEGMARSVVPVFRWLCERWGLHPENRRLREVIRQVYILRCQSFWKEPEGLTEALSQVYTQCL